MFFDPVLHGLVNHDLLIWKNLSAKATLLPGSYCLLYYFCVQGESGIVTRIANGF